MIDDIAGFNERKRIAIFSGKNYIRQRKGFKDIGKPFFTSFGAFGDSLDLAEITAVEGDN